MAPYGPWSKESHRVEDRVLIETQPQWIVDLIYFYLTFIPLGKSGTNSYLP